MPRPRKWRRICCLPDNRNFGPLNDGEGVQESVVMTLEEYETIRLIDLEGLNQAQCAESMGIARTTAQAIYGSARLKLAQCLVGGLRLTISGGDYVLCDGEHHGCRHCRRHRCCSSDA